jgi:type IVB pilus formation R64 PilN family outer membrane protein
MQNNFRRTALRQAVIALIAAVQLTGCANVTTQNAAQEVRAEREAKAHTEPAPAPVFQALTQSYLLGSPRTIKNRLPDVFEQHISLVAPPGQQQLSDLVAMLAQASGVTIHIDNTGDTSGSPVAKPDASLSASNATTTKPALSTPGLVSAQDNKQSLILDGSLRQVLNQITAGRGLWWKWRDDAVHVFRTTTETFNVPALNWASTSTGMISAQSGGATGGASSGGAGSATMSTMSKTDAWDNLQKMAQAVAGTDATVFADRNTGVLVVTAIPPEIEAVRAWFKSLSVQMQRQVAIDVHIYSIQTTAEDNYGFNLNALYSALNNKYGLNLVGAPTVAPLSGSTPASFGVSILKSATGTQFAGSTAVLQALSSLGHVSQVFDQSTITINGQPTSMQQAKNIQYINGTSTTQTANVGSTTSVMTGTLTPGFTLNFVPRVNGNHISLGMNMVMSTFDSLNPTVVGNTLVDLPQTSSYTFQRSFSLNSGDTLLLTGLTQDTSQTSHSGVGTPTFFGLGGGVDAQSAHQMFVIVVAARIL